MFNKKLVGFLTELSANNDREWFNENKQRYEDTVRTPALNFIEAFRPELEKLSDHFFAIPKKVGGSMMRPYRDARFSKDKTPFKTNLGIQFKHKFGKDVHAPGYYLHIAPDNIFIAAGVWRPESKALRNIRELIDEAPSAWGKILNDKALNKEFEFSGSSLIKNPRGFDKNHPNIESLKRKDFILVQNLNEEELYSGDVVSKLAKKYKAAQPLMRFLCEAQSIPF